MSRLLLVLSVVLALLLAACTAAPIADYTPTPEPAAESTPESMPAPGPAPTANAAVIARLGINPAQISLNVQGLPYTWQANAVEGTAHSATGGVASGLPDHIQINFGTLDPAMRQPTDPVLFIVPVDAYRALWDDADDDTVATRLNDIFANAARLPQPPPLRGYSILPVELAAGDQDFATQVGDTDFTELSATRNGFRFVGRFVEDAVPITNSGMAYIYQGFTNDAKHLVTFYYPAIASSQLPSSVEEMSAADIDAFTANPRAAIAAAAAALYDQPSDIWAPDVATLDALVASLAIPGVPANALVGKTWQLQARSSGDATEPVANAQNYRLTFNANGALEFMADCNVGMGSWNTLGGMAGSIAIDQGAMTLVACEDDSFSSDFLAALAEVQEFRVQPGGATLELVSGDGASSLIFTILGETDIVLPEAPQTPVEIPTAVPETAFGRVTAQQGVNVRGGPGTNFPIIAFAPFNQEGALVGRSADGQWFAVTAPNLPGGIGWVSGAHIATFNADDVPVIASPPTPVPTPVPPTSTPAPTPVVVPPTPTPVPQARINFSANRTQINQGECARLTWDVENVSAIWVYPIGSRFSDFPAVGQDSMEVCPTSTTTWEMRVQLTDGRTELRQVTITVNESNPLAGTNWLVSTIAGSAPLFQEQDLTLALAANGTFSGFGGCNSVNGTYTVSGTSINFVHGSTTMMACGGDADETQQAFQNALAVTSFFEFVGFQLVLRDFGGNEVLRMIRLN